jgi:CHAT domain-containing protein
VKTSPGMAPLNLVEKEAAQVERIAAVNSNDLIAYGSDTPARVHDVKNALSRTDIVHLACHGVQDRQDPLQSGFCLSDGKLTVSELMNIKLDRAFLAFLSACETAKGDQDQPDQAIHLAAAMLFCGFRSVIGTMW